MVQSIETRIRACLQACRQRGELRTAWAAGVCPPRHSG